jgi:MIP family channel proteins
MNSKSFVVELIGTFTLIFIGAGAAAIGTGGLVGVALAHGLVLMTMVYVIGPISGAHINPAVTLAIFAAGKMNFKDTVSYWIAQFAGGALGAGALYWVFGGVDNGLGATVLADGVLPFQGLFIEMVLTFLLVNAVLQAAVKGSAGQFAGLAIGGTLALAILMGGPLTGASLNPARTFGPALFTGTLNQFWIYLVGTGVGGLLAAMFANYLD